ncbi:MAG: bacillithiol system redox-active protein YtxJ [Crocinitomicaceae bacterium]
MGLFFTDNKSNFDWINLNSSEQLNEIIEQSNESAVLLFKHSTRCSISSMAKSRFEKEWKLDNEVCQTYYLDLITFRPISNEIAEKTGVEHQSPQVIVLKNKEVIYQASHNGIDANEIQALFKK